MGGAFTRLAVALSDKVFYTSPLSFTARFKKAVQMPVGIDTDLFKRKPEISFPKNSITDDAVTIQNQYLVIGGICFFKY